MSIAINPVFPVVAAQSVAAGVALQPGTVIDATVLKQLDANLVRIAIANLTIQVLSEVPLQPGQMLQLAVSQTPQGVRLQIVPGEGDAPSSASAASTGAAKADTVSVPKADVPVQTAAAGRVLTNLEALAVSAAVQTAAARQGSLSPLFANLGVVASSQTLPQTLQQAAAQLLAQRTPLSENLTGDTLKTAFRNSGLFMEQSLASSQTGNGPDLKAALIVFRQTVASWLGNAPAASASPQPSNVPLSAAPPLAPDGGDILLPQAPVRVAEDAAERDGKIRIYAPNEPLPTAANRVAAASAGLTALQEVLQGFPKGVQDAVADMLDAEARAGAAHVTDGEAITRTNVPPPPFRGSDTSAQSVALPSLAPDDAPATMAHRLIEDTDAALARQTLLQAASLPVDVPGARIDPTAPRWNFEIPFVTPQGTAVAQFEISRDGAGSEAEAASRVWRARFSLNVEPSGPVHALVSLSHGRTSVRMWAERSATAAQLRINAPQLSHALREAALEPGDIVIGEGAPPKAASPPAGHFLDRAL
ncbi:flagellar hook-length control protein FliK [Afipia massiliensis]|uniref:Flagellar hook-length control protein FliK n=1 Tax=Afipia massiliensis TaxID=211460 RepID=A0A4U6BV31_9BRAD|nr:flagellar hook-length control protein FliK [Afipia massiliensis]TKT72734.1 flagellar hook-length control protein FliK [Afipia massiliensis]